MKCVYLKNYYNKIRNTEQIYNKRPIFFFCCGINADAILTVASSVIFPLAVNIFWPNHKGL